MRRIRPWVKFVAPVLTMAGIGIVLALAPLSRAQPSSQLTIATGAEPDSIDITAGIFPPINYVVMRNVDEALWTYNNDGSIKHTVATWDRTPDGKMVTFHLKHGVKFQSGDELVADDVVFGFQRLMAKTPPFMRHGKFVDKITALDRYTVRVIFKKPDVTYFEGVSLFPASKAYFDRVGEKTFAEHPNGIGPYRWVDYKRGQYIDLTAFSGYYGKAPAIKNVRFVFVKDNEVRVAKLRAGEVDMIMDTPFPAVASLAAAGFRIVKLPANPTVSLEFDFLNKKAPWADIRVREAIAHAIDAQAIIKGLFDGVPERHPRLAPGEAGYDPSLKNYKYDPAQAKRLLTEAGYPNGFKMPLYYTAGFFYGFRQTAEAVVLYLKAVGIECEVHDLEGPKGFQFVSQVQKNPDMPFVAVSGMPVANSGLPSLEALYLSFYPKSPFVLYDDPKLTDGIEAAQSELDDKKRDADIKAMNKLLYDQYASITLWDGMSVFAMKKDVHYQPIEHRMPFMTLENVTESK